jgi:hypothetical protein
LVENLPELAALVEPIQVCEAHFYLLAFSLRSNEWLCLGK